MSNQPLSAETTPNKKRRGRPRKTTETTSVSTGGPDDDFDGSAIDIKEELDISDDDEDMGEGAMEVDNNEWLDVGSDPSAATASAGFTVNYEGYEGYPTAAVDEEVVDENYDPSNDFLQNFGKPQQPLPGQQVELGGAVVEGTLDIKFPTDGGAMVVDVVPTASSDQVVMAPPKNVTIVDATPMHVPGGMPEVPLELQTHHHPPAAAAATAAAAAVAQQPQQLTEAENEFLEDDLNISDSDSDGGGEENKKASGLDSSVEQQQQPPPSGGGHQPPPSVREPDDDGIWF